MAHQNDRTVSACAATVKVSPARCQHEHFAAHVGVGRLTKGQGGPVTSFTADITIRCAQCGARMRFLGVPHGSSYDVPTCSADGTELRAPIEVELVPEVLGVPPAAIQRHMLPLIRLARVERSRRGEGGLTPHSRMKLVQAFWPDYMKHAEVAWSVLVERPEAALATGRDQAAKDGDDHARS